MAFTYHIEANGNIAHVIGTGQGSLDEARNTFADLIANPQLHRPFGLLVDVRTVCNMPSRGEAESISNFALVLEREKHYTALLVKRGIQYGIARMIQLCSELRGAHIDVFIDDHSAHYWLWEQIARDNKSHSMDVNK
jgi:hypothetical protein